jgi:hypothetical protein
VSGSDETFIVRVRRPEGDAVVEHPRLGRRWHVGEVSQIGPLILRWLTPPPELDSGEQRRPDATTFQGGRS